MDAVDRVLDYFGDLSAYNEVADDTNIIFSSSDIEKICCLATDFFRKKPNVLYISSPVAIVGDLHGNINDLLRIFSYFSPPPATNYLFLGDFVDRGFNSLAVISLLLSLMIKYPDNVTLLRGNHEFGLINRYYGFFDEIITKYEDDELWNSFQQVFNYMPLCAIIDKQIFCVHGGISPLLKSVRDFNYVKKPLESYMDNQMVLDVLWSDPADSTDAFAENRRGLGCKYSAEAVSAFLEANKFKLMIRAHQCVKNGINIFANTLGMTVFSASNYNDSAKNKCGVVIIHDVASLTFYSLDQGLSLKKQECITLLFNDSKPGLFQCPKPKRKPHKKKKIEKDSNENDKEVEQPKPKKIKSKKKKKTEQQNENSTNHQEDKTKAKTKDIKEENDSKSIPFDENKDATKKKPKHLRKTKSKISSKKEEISKEEVETTNASPITEKKKSKRKKAIKSNEETH